MCECLEVDMYVRVFIGVYAWKCICMCECLEVDMYVRVFTLQVCVCANFSLLEVNKASISMIYIIEEMQLLNLISCYFLLIRVRLNCHVCPP